MRGISMTNPKPKAIKQKEYLLFRQKMRGCVLYRKPKPCQPGILCIQKETKSKLEEKAGFSNPSVHKTPVR